MRITRIDITCDRCGTLTTHPVTVNIHVGYPGDERIDLCHKCASIAIQKHSDEFKDFTIKKLFAKMLKGKA
jgi:hypothetical protein